MRHIDRKSDYPIHPLILNRWSARAMNGERIEDDLLMSLFEAARWAPSASNAQPWLFIYGKKGTVHWDRLFDLLVDFNKGWVKNGAVLGVILSKKLTEKEGKPSPSYALDAGAAWENICLEGIYRDLVVHGMAGFDYSRAKTELKIPDEYDVLAMFVIGKPAPKEILSLELQKREIPSTRKPVSEFIKEGIWR